MLGQEFGNGLQRLGRQLCCNGECVVAVCASGCLKLLELVHAPCLQTLVSVHQHARSRRLASTVMVHIVLYSRHHSVPAAPVGWVECRSMARYMPVRNSMCMAPRLQLAWRRCTMPAPVAACGSGATRCQWWWYALELAWQGEGSRNMQ
jgi:hypothetical protein